MTTSSSTRSLLMIAVAACVLFGGFVWLLFRLPPDESQIASIPQDERVSFVDTQDPAVGPIDAQVVVHLYGDFECPACRSAESAVRDAMQRYQDRVRFVWKDFPLPIHKSARVSAYAARCAQQQGKFWEYHDRLFTDQAEWVAAKAPQEAFLRYAQALGLNADAFSACLAQESERSKVEANLAEGAANAVDRTPTVFINKKRYFGMSPAEWRTQLDAALNQFSTTTPSGT